VFPSNEEIEAFQRDGAVCLRGVVSPYELDQLTRAIDQNLRDPSPLAIEATKPRDPGRFLEDFCNWQRIEEYELSGVMGSFHRYQGSVVRQQKCEYVYRNVWSC
jgi:hypothetical protein